jgi:hypothetical protein
MDQPDGHAFLVLEADPTVARDLEETLRAFDPRAVILVAATPGRAHEIMSGLDRLTAALLRLPAAERRSGDLPRAAEALGARVVMLEARPEEGAPEGWAYTGRPFGVDAVARALERMGIRRG